MKNLLKLSLFLPAILMTCMIKAQEINYKVLDNRPQTPKLAVGFNYGDIMLTLSEEEIGNGGIGVFVDYKPIDRLRVYGKSSLGVYGMLLNDNEGATGIRKLGGIYSDAAVEYSWYRKGVNTVYKNSDQLITDRFSVPGFANRSRYINYPFNRMIERVVRGGVYNHVYPHAAVTGGFVGIGKYYTKSAKLETDQFGTITGGTRRGYYLDYVFGATSYQDPDRTGDNSGFRLGFVEERFSNWPVYFKAEIGGLPAIDNYYMSLTFGFRLYKIDGHAYEGEYATRNKSESKIVNLFRLF